MSKYNTKEAEPLVSGSLIAAELLMDEARDKAFGPPSITVTDCKFFSGKPQAVDIDRDHDGKPDATGKITYSFFGNIDKIDVTGKDGSKEYSIQFNRFLGVVNSASLDLKGDGTTDSTLYPKYGWFSSKVNGIAIDRNNDRSTDAAITFNRGWFTGDIYRATFDRNNDGKPENYYDLEHLEPKKE